MKSKRLESEAKRVQTVLEKMTCLLKTSQRYTLTTLLLSTGGSTCLYMFNTVISQSEPEAILIYLV